MECSICCISIASMLYTDWISSHDLVAGITMISGNLEDIRVYYLCSTWWSQRAAVYYCISICGSVTKLPAERFQGKFCANLAAWHLLNGSMMWTNSHWGRKSGLLSSRIHSNQATANLPPWWMVLSQRAHHEFLAST
jgi:hypothetical protein